MARKPKKKNSGNKSKKDGHGKGRKPKKGGGKSGGFESRTPQGRRGRNSEEDRGDVIRSPGTGKPISSSGRFKKFDDEQSPKPQRGGRRGRFDQKRFRQERPFRSRKELDPHLQSRPQALANVQINPRGFGFLIFEEASLRDQFIDPKVARQFFHGDRVKVYYNKPPGYAKDPETDLIVHHVELYRRRVQSFVGRFKKPNIAIFQNKGFKIEVGLNRNGFQPASGEWIRAELLQDEYSDQPQAKVIEIYGEEVPASADMDWIIGEFGLVESHTEEAIAEAESFTQESITQEMKSRKDLTAIPMVTVDGADARDFDDAIHVEKKAQGYSLWVGIADVSYFVKKGGDLDSNAAERATSVYFPERAIHMLPKTLSENLCSLVPQQKRLSLVVKINFSLKGKIKRVQLYDAVIESHQRITYDELEKWRLENLENSDWQYNPYFELYKILKRRRHVRGSIDFEFPERVTKLDAVFEPREITAAHRWQSHQLIEEFMIAANEAVTRWMLAQNKRFVYRIHENPSDQALDRFFQTAKSLGLNLKKPEGDITPQYIADLIPKIKGIPSERTLMMTLLRSMKQARYSPSHDQHFGLASTGYTHFTSPIRRYPDLMVHRMLKSALKKNKSQKDPYGNVELEQKCSHCNYQERLADEAERQMEELKMVRLLAKHVGDEFEGTIISVGHRGILVEIESPFVKGLIPESYLDEENFAFNPDRSLYVGRQSRQKLTLGDVVRVRVEKADFDQRSAFFALVGGQFSPD